MRFLIKDLSDDELSGHRLRGRVGRQIIAQPTAHSRRPTVLRPGPRVRIRRESRRAHERNAPRYNPRMLDAEQFSEATIGVGTRCRTELETMGQTRPMVVEFTGFERPWRLGR